MKSSESFLACKNQLNPATALVFGLAALAALVRKRF